MDVTVFSRVFEALPSPYLLLNRELRIVAVNAAYLEAAERKRENVVGRMVRDLFPNPGEGRDKLQQSYERVLETGLRQTLPYLHYPIAGADGTIRDKYWTAVQVPIFGEDGEVEYILQQAVDVSELASADGDGALAVAAFPAASQLIERTRETEKTAEEFRRLFQQAPGFVVVVSGPNHEIKFASDGFATMVNNRATLGMAGADALPEMIEQGFFLLLDRVYHEGYFHSAEAAKVIINNDPSQPPLERYLDFTFNPIKDRDGHITGVFVHGIDRTEAVKAQRRQRLLIDELNHRVKNTMATVQSIARQTLRTTDDLDTARSNFESRLIALSKAHTILSQRSWRDTEIGQLVREELSAFDDERVRYGGPIIPINAKSTIALALVLHELATNAAKHGALSSADGVLSVSWEQGANTELMINWVERGGPRVAEPTRTGFGSRLLRTVVTGELGGTLNQRYAAEGFSALLSVPPAAYGAQEGDFG
ncbi:MULTISPECIES: HWE histidine kinase domain-containing protein [unclassified Devosia]|uniref:sensor histidine kinase n=1 Tax=unclassified Devosia TaxID=196773 RepID=UPI00145DC3F4|nr:MULTISPECIES: HWE histidine kinase domain-containing protein [unclassified Devosia]MBJ6986647.1 PAS domain-containing protein [Devosia sp. MC521]QMW61684.1 PAS domain-containing protein [Devosia sp. MC521]